MIAKRAIVKGMVQGVGFRASTMREATRIGGLAGWVRNLPNGDVELFVQGEDSRVRELLQWCRKGPLVARVEHVTESDAKPDSALSGFSVRP